MAIVYRKGDLIEAFEKGQIEALAHGCNCSGGFGAGIAGQIAKKWPLVKEKYKESFKEDKCILGQIHGIGVKEGIIFNCYTQQKYIPYGIKHIDYDAIRTVMTSLCRIVKVVKCKIGIPKIGSGLAGGNWSEIETIINDVFGNEEIYVYTID